MPEDKLIEFIEWIGQQTTKTQIEYVTIYKSTLEEDKERAKVLKAKAQAYHEVWGKILRMANNED